MAEDFFDTQEEQMQGKHVVITGSTRGIGYGLAGAFLARGCTVTVSGRGEGAVAAAVDALSRGGQAGKLLGLACDVTDPAQVQALWDGTVARFGKVGLWVNNAGSSGEQGLVWELSPGQAQATITTNLLGTVYGCQTAMRGMLAQGSGAIYNMEGMGSDGRKHAGLSLYGTSKYAIHYFTESLALEARGTPVLVGALRPGMVITDLITDRYRGRPEEWERAKKIFNIIADRVETVAPWLAERMLANRKRGAILAYASPWKLLWRFVSQPVARRDLFGGEHP